MDRFEDDDSNSLTPITSTDGREFVNLSVLSVYQSAEDLIATSSASKPQIVNLNPTPGQAVKVNGSDPLDNIMSHQDNSISKARRKDFCREEGLELEPEQAEEGSALTFIKIHAPEEVLRRYSEILKLRMPMKEIPKLQDVHDKTSSLMESVCTCVDKVMGKVYVDHQVFPPKSHRFTAVYSRDKEYLFDTEADDFFTPAIRSRIVDFILDRQYYVDEGHHDPLAFGINRLTSEQVYSAAYPLHDGDLKTPGSQRHTLLENWASITKCLRYQPLDYVKEYFGVKIGLYFAWLGFYTHMLIPASIVGILCFAYSCVTLYQNQPSEDICNKNVTIKMCPICDYWCDYWNLSDTCLHARITYLFDNATTVFFAIFMSFWAALFLELWKRYSAEITHRWDLTGFDIQEEHPRPQYLVLLALAAVLGVVLYRMSVLAALSVFGDKMYMWLAEYLTELELIRTQTEFDDSLTLKIYLLQFINYYASIFYIAFFKGKFVGYPGNYNRFMHYRQEECGPGGCLMELCIQLAIIMMRLDARKLLTYYRRPVTQRVRDIGVWYRILDSIGKLSVITNGFIIAFTTDFIPRLLYQIEISENRNLEGYLDYSLASFNTSEFEPGYADYRHAHSSENKYEKTSIYWHILAARFAFVVVFEIRREAYLTNQLIIDQEARRARSHSHASSQEPSIAAHRDSVRKRKVHAENNCAGDVAVTKTLLHHKFMPKG
ncbi:hypothetical protein B566_EDAN014431 [Ephemera danica]|nr:hypothetical protein B566_EDAN014431 [Ephemera danica]